MQAPSYSNLRMLVLPAIALVGSTAGAAGGPGIEEIVVTAQKREQSLQDVPISITALTGDSLVANRITDVRDLNAVAPNLSVRMTSGGLQQPAYSMRGIITSGSAPGSDKGISVYIDGVYLQNTNGAVFELADIDRIEVLKGPQGTLFGRNATGGAISFVTRDPSGTFGIQQEVSYGNYDQFRSKTNIDLPAWGPLSAALSYIHSERRGDIRNLGAGAVWDFRNATGGTSRFRRAADYLGSQNMDTARVALKLDLDAVSLSYKFDYSENDYSPEGQGVAGSALYVLNSVAPGFGDGIQFLLDNQPDSGVLTPISTKRPAAINNWFSTRSYTRNQGHNLTLRWALSDDIRLTNILASRKMRTGTSFQLSGLGGLIDVFPGSPTAGQPYLLLDNATGIEQEQWSNEIQLNIDKKWANITAGYIHFDDRLQAGSYPNTPNVIQFSSVPDFTWPATGNRRTRVHSKSDALFLQPEIHVTDKFDFVLGARVTVDDKEGVDNTLTAGYSMPIDYREHKTTYSVGLNHQTTDNIFLFAKYGTGYISGGFLATRAFKPETAKSWEAGIKGDFFNRHLRSNLSFFDVKYEDMQFNASGVAVGIIEAPEVVVNGGNSKARGFEWENTAIPFNNLTLGLNIGYTDFKYTRVDPVIGTIDTYLPINRPKWTNTGSIQYETGKIIAGGHLVFRVDANYRSKTYLAFGQPSEELIAATTTHDSWILNGRIALSELELLGTTAQVAVWGKNLADNRQLANVSSLAFLYPGSYERARTYGIDLSVAF